MNTRWPIISANFQFLHLLLAGQDWARGGGGRKACRPDLWIYNILILQCLFDDKIITQTVISKQSFDTKMHKQILLCCLTHLHLQDWSWRYMLLDCCHDRFCWEHKAKGQNCQIYFLERKIYWSLMSQKLKRKKMSCVWKVPNIWVQNGNKTNPQLGFLPLPLETSNEKLQIINYLLLQVSYGTALDVYIICCFVFVFLSLAEFAFTNFVEV